MDTFSRSKSWPVFFLCWARAVLSFSRWLRSYLWEDILFSRYCSLSPTYTPEQPRYAAANGIIVQMSEVPCLIWNRIYDFTNTIPILIFLIGLIRDYSILIPIFDLVLICDRPYSISMNNDGAYAIFDSDNSSHQSQFSWSNSILINDINSDFWWPNPW